MEENEMATAINEAPAPTLTLDPFGAAPAAPAAQEINLTTAPTLNMPAKAAMEEQQLTESAG